MFQVKDVHEVKDRKEIKDEGDVTYVSAQKIADGEQAREWGGLLCDVFNRDGDYGPQKHYAFLSSRGQFVFRATKLLEPRFNKLFIGDYATIEFEGMHSCKKTKGKYGVFTVSKSEGDSLKGDKLKEFISWVDENRAGRTYDTPQPDLPYPALDHKFKTDEDGGLPF